MARYADIDVLLEHLTTSDEGNFRTAITQWLEMHQVEDVAPVVHAHKVRAHSQGGGTHWVVCSHCEKPIDWQDAYCKYCGAKMDEVVE